MKVFKFGGASVKSADAVRNVKSVLDYFPKDNLVIVFSAMGKTTNSFEWLVNAHFHNKSLVNECLDEIVDYHNNIIRDLFPDIEHNIYVSFNEFIHQIEDILSSDTADNYNFIYDQLVSFGEIISTSIISAYLMDVGVKNEWADARKLIRTTNNYREAQVDWSTTEQLVKAKIGHGFGNSNERKIIITQGFIAHTKEGFTSTLGREGSDYSAGILAYCLNAESVTIWKDVPGMLNADPKWFNDTIKLDTISYKEAIELSYYGASVIHPKTIKPLENKEIPLYVKSFLNPEANGTVIQRSTENDSLVPSFIFKMDQVLISISPKDFSFIEEDNLSTIFNQFHEHGVKMNLMQNSAISFSACIDYNKMKTPALIEDLSQSFNVRYNEGLELVTVRHYDQNTIERVTLNKEILVEQKSRYTARMVMKDLSYLLKD